MIKVYHGSIAEIKQPEVSKGRDNLDFGKAFYVTRLREQAFHWAQVVYSRYEENQPVLNSYLLNLDEVIRRGYKILVFDKYDKSWLEFIAASRSGKKPWKGYDLIEGGIANDRVIETVEGFLAGDISADVAVGKLQYQKPNNQIAILNQSIIDELLQFIGSEIIEIA